MGKQRGTRGPKDIDPPRYHGPRNPRRERLAQLLDSIQQKGYNTGGAGSTTQTASQQHSHQGHIPRKPGGRKPPRNQRYY